jgi:tetratricopeptide (TPR) repeat protein
MDFDDDNELARFGARDQPGHPDYFMTHLYRCRMNGWESAQYSMAELLLQRGDLKGAVARLDDALAQIKDEDVRDMTRFNLGSLSYRLGDAEGAAKHYRQITGVLRHRANRRLIAILAETGKPDDAAKLTEDLVAKAKENGEKLALLHRLALTYKSCNLPDRSLAVYGRIAKEFPPEAIQQMAEAVRREVNAAYEEIGRAQRGEGQEPPDRLFEQLHQRRPWELRAAGRWDELRAYEEAVRIGQRRFERAERERREREERQRAEPQRDREGPPPPRKNEF